MRLIFLVIPLLTSFAGALPLPERSGISITGTLPISGRSEKATDGRVAHWVLFTDKGFQSRSAVDRAIEQVASTYNIRATQRRMLRRTAPGLFDERDLPVSNTYIDAVGNTGTQLRTQSRWLNGVSILATEEQIAAVAKLPFVKSIRPVKRLRTDTIKPLAVEEDTDPAAGSDSFYGLSESQLELINLIALHDAGFTGEGVIIGVLDTGFRTTHAAFNNPDHPTDIVAEWDFVNDDPVTTNEEGDSPDQHDHGSYILGTLAAYLPGELVGSAYDASYILCKVEDAPEEYNGEEDFFVAGLEFIEANGGDVATSSVVIYVGYDQNDLDGLTSVMTVGVNVATENGIIVCQGAGNEGHDADPSTSRLVPPADAFDAITVGAVQSSGSIAGFSSDGPTADGRIKPEVLAQGVNVWTIAPGGDTGFDTASGTSLATPQAAGVVACLLQAHPDWTLEQMRNFLFKTADYYATYQTYDSTYVLGYGLINAYRAHDWDCNDNGVIDADDVGNGTSLDMNMNGHPDECDLPADFDGDEIVGTRDYSRFTLCMQGPEITVSRGCLLADADEDGDVDMADFAAVQGVYSN